MSYLNYNTAMRFALNAHVKLLYRCHSVVIGVDVRHGEGEAGTKYSLLAHTREQRNNIIGNLSYAYSFFS
jgi:hypothetical protein